MIGFHVLFRYNWALDLSFNIIFNVNRNIKKKKKSLAIYCAKVWVKCLHIRPKTWKWFYHQCVHFSLLVSVLEMPFFFKQKLFVKWKEIRQSDYPYCNINRALWLYCLGDSATNYNLRRRNFLGFGKPARRLISKTSSSGPFCNLWIILELDR